MRKLAVGLCVVGSAFAAQAVDLPTMGWSSWNTYRVNISEELIKRQADALVDGGFAARGDAERGELCACARVGRISDLLSAGCGGGDAKLA